MDLLRVKGLTQAETAEKTGVKANALNQWIKGKREPDFDTLLKVCFCLDVVPAEILSYQKAKNVLEDIKRTKQLFSYRLFVAQKKVKFEKSNSTFLIALFLITRIFVCKIPNAALL